MADPKNFQFDLWGLIFAVLHHRARISASTRRSPVVAVVGSVLASLVMVVPNAVAATINVTPGAVDAINNGNCSIREAIVAANTDAAVDACTVGSGADTLNAPGTFVLTTADNDANGLPVISSTMTINNAKISRASGAPAFRIFAVASTGNLTLNAVTVSGGLASDCSIPAQSTHVCGGGIANDGTLTVQNSNIVNNHAIGNVDIVEGGGIHNTRTATVASSLLSGNSAINTALGFSQGVGGGINNGGVADDGMTLISGTLNVQDSRIHDNATSCAGGDVGFGCFSLGAGIYNSVGTLDMQDSALIGNTGSCSGENCFGVGAGLTNDGTSTLTNSRVKANTTSCSGITCSAFGGGIASLGTVNLINSRVVDNTASCSTADCYARAGGVESAFGGTLNMDNSRVANNILSAPNGLAQGGGLFSDGTTTLTNSAVTGNTASGVPGEGGGIYDDAVAPGSVILNHTRVKNNTPDNCEPAIGTCT